MIYLWLIAKYSFFAIVIKKKQILEIHRTLEVAANAPNWRTLSTLIYDTTFQINSAKLYIPVVTLSINDNTKVLENLKHGFKIVVCCNK